MERSDTGELGSLGDRILRAKDALPGQTFTAEDRRKVIRVSVDGAQRLKNVELDPRWGRSIQSQNLAREVFDLYRTAREQASVAAEETYAEAGFVGPLAADAQSALREAMGRLPGMSDLMLRLEAETVRSERARGCVVAEFKLDGEPLGLDIRPRYAGETEAELLALAIRGCLEECEEAVIQRRSALAAELAAAQQPIQGSEARLEEFKQTLAELRARFG